MGNALADASKRQHTAKAARAEGKKLPRRRSFGEHAGSPSLEKLHAWETLSHRGHGYVTGIGDHDRTRRNAASVGDVTGDPPRLPPFIGTVDANHDPGGECRCAGGAGDQHRARPLMGSERRDTSEKDASAA